MITRIPDVTSHGALLQALRIIREEVECRQEDVQNVAAWTADLTDRLDTMREELEALAVDVTTIGNVHALRDSVADADTAAKRYAAQTDTTVQLAEVAARGARTRHSRIADAVAESTVGMAKPKFYSAE